MSLKQRDSFSASVINRFAEEFLTDVLDKLVYYSLLALIVLTAIQKGSIELWRETAFAFIICILTAISFIEGILKKRWFVNEHLAFVPLLLITVLAFLQSLFSSDTGILFSVNQYETWLAAIKFLSIILFAALLLSHISNLKRLNQLVHLIIIIGLVSGLFGIWQHVTKSDVIEFFQYNTQGAEFGQFNNRNHFAFLMEMTLGLTLGLSLSNNIQRLIRVAYLTIAAVLFIALVMTTSRGALLSTISLLIFVVFLSFFIKDSDRNERHWRTHRSRFKRFTETLLAKIIFIVCLSIVSVFGVIWFGGQPLIQRWKDVPKEIELKDQTGASRVEIWRATWRLIKDHPIAGSSFGAFGTAITPYHIGTGRWTPQQAHNDYLELLASSGVIGGVLGVLYLIGILRFARKQLRSEYPYRRAVCWGALAGLFAIGLHSLVDFGLHITINAIVCMALFVIVIANFDGNLSAQSA